MIQIKNPCDANWQEMTPAQSGKYCGACEKVVIDFSKMSDAEIKNYFITYKKQKTCGRFLDSQLERPLIVPSVTHLNKFLNRLNQIPVARTILLFLTSTSMWISSCVKNNDSMTTGEPASTNKSCNTPLTGDTTVVPEEPKELLIKEDTVKIGEVTSQQTVKFMPPQVLMGDVCVYTPSKEPDTVSVTIPGISPDTSDVNLNLKVGTVMMRDTISQEIKRRKE